MSHPYPGQPTGQAAFQQGQGFFPQQPPVQYTQQQPMQGFPPVQAPQGYPIQQPAPQQQYMPQLGGDLNARLPNDPSVPQELRGRTVGEALRFYGVMREDFQRRQVQPQPQMQQPQQQPMQQYAPQQRQSAQPGQYPQQGYQQQQGGVDPVKQAVADVLNEVLPQALAPVTGPIMQQNLLNTYNSVKSRYQDWGQLESEVISSMQGADQSTLSNPAAWEAAYFHAKGRAMSRPPQQQGQQQFQGGPQQQFAGPSMPYQQQGYQSPVGSSFAEGPTPQASGMTQMQQDPRDEVFAKRYGMPLEVYRSWKGGRVGLMPQQQGQQPQQPGQYQGGQPQAQYQGGQQMPQQQFGQPLGQPVTPQGYYQPQQSGGQYAP